MKLWQIAMGAFSVLLIVAVGLFIGNLRSEVTSQSEDIAGVKRELQVTRCARLEQFAPKTFRLVPVPCPGGGNQSPSPGQQPGRGEPGEPRQPEPVTQPPNPPPTPAPTRPTPIRDITCGALNLLC